MWQHEVREWQDPLVIASAISSEENDWVLLHSSLELDYTGQRSILALHKTHEITDSFNNLETLLTNNKDTFENAWFGYLGYGLKNSLENLPDDALGIINLPDLWMASFALILVFDHHHRHIDIFAASDKAMQYFPALQHHAVTPHDSPNIKELHSNMTKQEYIEHVETVKEAILRGDLYQANITRKFFGEFKSTLQPFDLFIEICKASPAPYSSFLKMGNSHIISSSPERFISIDADGNANSKPIKGSAARFNEIAEDNASRIALQNSEKDKAENLMIVDLMRNDFSRSCEAGSVQVDSLFEVTSYATVHHMSSSISGHKKTDISSLDFVKACFPPGSMTGAPKIKAMELCSTLEKQARGVYSGSIGWFGGDGSIDLSVVIRTLIVQDKQFEFQVGGAIVADSDPIKEWEETLIKAKGIMSILGIDEDAMTAL